MKKTWGVLSDTLKKCTSKSQVEFIDEEHVIRDTDIANTFNDYFVNITRTLTQQIQPSHLFNKFDLLR